MKTKIYTKSGDKGETSVIGGQRVSKADQRLDTYGSVDELNALIGVIMSLLSTHKNLQLQDMLNTLDSIQNELFVVGSQLACVDDDIRKNLPQLSTQITSLLEKQIDTMNLELPELKDFILPGGHLIASHLHVARTVCRRTERAVVILFNNTSEMTKNDRIATITFFNRLSDYLFIAARFANIIFGGLETKWKK